MYLLQLLLLFIIIIFKIILFIFFFSFFCLVFFGLYEVTLCCWNLKIQENVTHKKHFIFLILLSQINTIHKLSSKMETTRKKKKQGRPKISWCRSCWRWVSPGAKHFGLPGSSLPQRSKFTKVGLHLSSDSEQNFPEAVSCWWTSCPTPCLPDAPWQDDRQTGADRGRVCQTDSCSYIWLCLCVRQVFVCVS